MYHSQYIILYNNLQFIFYFISRNKLGGLSAVIYYFTIHNDATQLHRNPAARENFAFPFILWQMFYLTVCIERHTMQLQRLKKQKINKNRIINQHAIKMSTLSVSKIIITQLI